MFGSGKAAFRFLLPRSVALEDPVTKPLVEQSIDSLSMWYGDDRRVVMYPCNNNDTLNFVLIHPDTESHAGPSDGQSFAPAHATQMELTCVQSGTSRGAWSKSSKCTAISIRR